MTEPERRRTSAVADQTGKSLAAVKIISLNPLTTELVPRERVQSSDSVAHTRLDYHNRPGKHHQPDSLSVMALKGQFRTAQASWERTRCRGRAPYAVC